MVDFLDWGVLVGIIIGWASLALLLIGFLAGAASARRRQGTGLRRTLGDEREGPGFEPTPVRVSGQRGRAPVRSLAAPRR